MQRFAARAAGGLVTSRHEQDPSGPTGRNPMMLSIAVSCPLRAARTRAHHSSLSNAQRHAAEDVGRTAVGVDRIEPRSQSILS